MRCLMALIVPCLLSAQAVVVESKHLAHTRQVCGATPAQALAQLDSLLKSAGTSLRAAVKLNVVLAGDAAINGVQGAIDARFKAPAGKPAVSYVAGTLACPAASTVAMDAIAPVGRTRQRNANIGYLRTGPRLYVSGQSATGTIEEATKATLEKLKQNLAFQGATLLDVVQVKSFLDPIASADSVRRQIDAFFGPNPPPQVFVEWTSKNRIEIELIAAATPLDQKVTVEHLWPPDEKPSPVFCRIARVASPVTIYLPGLFGVTPNDPTKQIREIYDQMQSMLKPVGSDLKHLVKATYYVADDESSRKLNELRPEYYDPKHPPAASKAGVRSSGKPGMPLTLDMIAVPANPAP